MTSSVSATSSASGLAGTTSTASTGTSDAAASQDRFLKLLVAQLNNQDPMNPMDNAQMTSQMAQINTVSGIAQLNETMKSMASQFSAMQVLQGASMIGRDVLTAGNSMAVSSGVGKAAFELAAAADKVSVEISSPGGQLLGTLNLGPMSAGQHNFEWDASSYTGAGSPTFKITSSMGPTAVAATALTRDSIASVSTSAGAMNLTLKGGTTVTYDAIKGIL
jgi:flagellar basal-body rod modification protein FlgD